MAKAKRKIEQKLKIRISSFDRVKRTRSGKSGQSVFRKPGSQNRHKQI